MGWTFRQEYPGVNPVPRSCLWRIYPGCLQGAWYGVKSPG